MIALYNPVSRARPWQLGRAFELLRDGLPAATPVVLGRRSGDRTRNVVGPRWRRRSRAADMATLVIVGSAETRVVARAGRRRWFTRRAQRSGSASR